MKSTCSYRAMLALSLLSTVALAQPPRAIDDRMSAETLSLGLRGVYFVPNLGQWSDSAVHYGLRSRGLDLAFRDSSLTMHMMREANESNESTDASPKREREMLPLDDPAPLPDARGSLAKSSDFEYLTLTVTFPGSNDVPPVGAQPQTARFNYFVGGEGRSAASDVQSFGEVVYPNLYDGVDLHVMGNDDGVLKYEFHVAPGADYSQIRIAYGGIDSLCIDDTGDLHINTSFGTLADGAPIVWQQSGGTAVSAVKTSTSESQRPDGRDARPTRSEIAAHFEITNDHTCHIALDAPIDPTRELIIDPDVEWMTYLGGTDTDDAYGIAVDLADNALATGYTVSTDFEGRRNAHRGGVEDAFVVEIDPIGQLRWMDYLGGDSSERGYGIAVDGAGHALVAGITASHAFEGHNNNNHGRYTDAFAVKVRRPTGGGVHLAVYASCPSGGSIQIEWTGATVGGTIALLFARGIGSIVIPNNHPCAGTQLGLDSNQLQIAYHGNAGKDGSRTINANAGPAPCGGYLQLLDLSTCATSHIARIQ